MATESLMEELGTRVRAIRVDRRLTQQQLADRANISLGALQHLEQGAPASTRTLAKVLQALEQEHWIGTLGPTRPAFSPLAVLAQQKRAASKTPSRVRPLHDRSAITRPDEERASSEYPA